MDSVFLHLRNQEKKANREIDISILGKIVYDIARKNIFKKYQLIKIFNNLDIAVEKKRFVFTQFNITTTENDFEKQFG